MHKRDISKTNYYLKIFSEEKTVPVVEYLGVNTFANISFISHPLRFRKSNIFVEYIFERLNEVS